MSASAPIDIVGTWARTQSCEEQLAAFDASGLPTAKVYEWITANWVPGKPPPTPKDHEYCAGAVPAREHSHFFTSGGQFGSLDENGGQVDDGDYTVKSAGILTFPSHGREFGYAGEITVEYEVDGDTATFNVRLPADCLQDAHCTEAYGWALSAFFGPAPWHRRP